MTILIAAIISFVIGILAGAILQQTRAEKVWCEKMEQEFNDN